jgi:catechol 2,3-dioxygenase-like lactoylglutathione lyase family enzyme
MTPLGRAPLVAFVATANPAWARDFYEKTLGLTFVADDPFALVFDANGTRLRVQKVDTVGPVAHTVLGWQVPSIRAAVADLAARGVVFRRYEGMAQDEAGIWTTPGGFVAWFQDPDGNLLSLSESSGPTV